MEFYTIKQTIKMKYFIICVLFNAVFNVSSQEKDKRIPPDKDLITYQMSKHDMYKKTWIPHTKRKI